jgi:hypothetical protein
MVCRDDWESRHPADFFRGVKDNQSTPWLRPESQDAGGTDIEGDTIPPTFDAGAKAEGEEPDATEDGYVDNGTFSDQIIPGTIQLSYPPTISGTPDTSIFVGESYLFLPTASDPDDDPLVFSITNKPSWATFSTTTGSLSGDPVSGDMGIYTGIIISVSDGYDTVPLDAFNIEVLAGFNEAVLADIPVGFWNHESGALEIDSSGYGNHATTTVNVSEIAGVQSGAGDYDTVLESKQRIPNAISIQDLGLGGGSIITVEMVIKLNATAGTNNPVVISKGQFGSTAGWYVNFQNIDGTHLNQLTMAIYSGGWTERMHFSSATEIPINQYLHLVIAGEFFSGVKKIYINNAPDTIYDINDPTGSQTSDNASELYISGFYNAFVLQDTNFLDASIDSLILYDYELPADRVAAHFALTGI